MKILLFVVLFAQLTFAIDEGAKRAPGGIFSQAFVGALCLYHLATGGAGGAGGGSDGSRLRYASPEEGAKARLQAMRDLLEQMGRMYDLIELRAAMDRLQQLHDDYMAFVMRWGAQSGQPGPMEAARILAAGQALVNAAAAAADGDSPNIRIPARGDSPDIRFPAGAPPSDQLAQLGQTMRRIEAMLVADRIELVEEQGGVGVALPSPGRDGPAMGRRLDSPPPPPSPREHSKKSRKRYRE